MKKYYVSFSALALFFSLAVTPAAAMQSPFPLLSGKTASAKPVECDSPPSAIVKLETVSKYKQTDKSKSTIDKKAEAQFKRDVKPIGKFMSRVVRYANQYVESGGKKTYSAQCAVQWLDAWAKAGALTQVRNDKSFNTVGKYIAGLALAYLQVRDVPGLDAKSKARVEGWLVRISRDVMRYHDETPGSTASRNNHRYWSGLGVAASGVAANDTALFHWGMNAARVGLKQVQKDGSLPLEMDRKERARDYHLYAITPLVMLAELGKANGVDLYTEEGGALHRAVRLGISTFNDPSFFEEATGKEQLDYPDAGTRASRLAWLEAYNRRFPSEQGAALLARNRPASMTFLGGNLTIVYGGRR